MTSDESTMHPLEFLPPAYFALESPEQRLIRHVALINREHRGATRAELARLTGLGPAAVTRIVFVLIAAGALRCYTTGAWAMIYIARPPQHKEQPR